MPIKPNIEWLHHNIPKSIEFKDTFYSIEDGLLETNHVFINGNNILNRWHQKSQFTIAELGFGTGLNFFETARQFEKLRISNNSRLNYVSFELFPMSKTQMNKALSQWSKLQNYAKIWLDTWQISEGWNTFTKGPISLQLAVGHVKTMLPDWKSKADAWYLDGFNPKTNKEMWELELLREVCRHTVEQGTFATYTAAGWVSRNLQSAGFEVVRKPGFGTKKEMLVGCKKLN